MSTQDQTSATRSIADYKPPKDQLPPHSPDAEAGALACILTALPAEGISFLNQLQALDFSDLRHQPIFRAFLKLHANEEIINSASLYIRLRNDGEMENAGGLAYVTGLSDKTQSPAHFPAFLNQVKEMAARRQRLKEGTRIVAEALDLSVPIESMPKIRTPETKLLSELTEPRDDGTELIKNRFLIRKGSLLVVGPTGAGKSALAMQMAIHWAIGKPCFDLRPTGKHRLLIVQAENDDGDLWDMFQGIIQGCGFKQEEKDEASRNVRICTLNDRTGEAPPPTHHRALCKRCDPDMRRRPISA